MLLLATRQGGKSSVAAALAIGTALLQPKSPVLVLSPSLRQSGELFRKVLDLHAALGRPVPVVAESACGWNWPTARASCRYPERRARSAGSPAWRS